MHILLVALGGACGSVLRYLVGLFTIRWLGPNFPWGTITVNILGSLMIGLFAELVLRKFNASADMRVLIVTGFLGGFTTFSAFSLDFISLVERGAFASAAAYMIFSIVLSVAAVFAGLTIGRIIF